MSPAVDAGKLSLLFGSLPLARSCPLAERLLRHSRCGRRKQRRWAGRRQKQLRVRTRIAGNFGGKLQKIFQSLCSHLIFTGLPPARKAISESAEVFLRAPLRSCDGRRLAKESELWRTAVCGVGRLFCHRGDGAACQ
ncbi:hypothetical protein Atu0532 [Agrobacterium fabrum str. C58]|uniref:Uncharacterized protein n=1 Tax=Agrobacterium fabrum (strain C58 / ATCC 33970) TaxID=176299 RepID=Q8UHX6_AGRFC|nr:hypothetical protein Atu0532 [Agrobacterium fabrum str. C58]